MQCLRYFNKCIVNLSQVNLSSTQPELIVIFHEIHDRMIKFHKNMLNVHQNGDKASLYKPQKIVRLSLRQRRLKPPSRRSAPPLLSED